MAVITIVGSGMMGSALAFPARENGHEVRLVGTHLDRGIIDACRKTGRHPKFDRDFPEGTGYFQIEELGTALDGCDLVIGGVSSFGVDWFGENVLPAVPDGVPVLTVTKGLMDTPDGRLLTYPDVWKEMIGKACPGKEVSLNAVGGPCTSYELVQHDRTEVCFCGKDPETLRYIRSLMQTDYYHVSLSSDVTGVESAVALKNGYALAVAMTIGLNRRRFGGDSPLHFNSQAAVFGQSLLEMEKLLGMQGARSVENLAVGIGDLYVTVYGGRTRQIGILLGEGVPLDEALERLNGVTLESLVVAERVARALNVLAKKGKADLNDFPLLMHVDAVMKGERDPELPWDLFTREDF